MADLTRAQRLLLGDWSRIVRDPLDVLRLVFGVGAVVAVLLGDLDDAVRLGFTFAIVLVLRHINVPRLFDLAVLLGMLLQGFGNTLGIFTSFAPYDNVVHFVLSLGVAATLYLLLVRLDVVPDLTDARGRRQIGIFLVTVLIGISVGALYEIYEWCADNWLGGNLKTGYNDTISDLVDDTAAAIAAGVLLVLWAQRGWATTRRMPPARVAAHERDDAELEATGTRGAVPCGSPEPG